MTIGRCFYVGCLMPLILGLCLLNARAYSPGDIDTVVSQLNFLDPSLRAGGGERMQKLFPEGYFFSWALYGLAAAQTARQLPPDDARRSTLLDRAREAIARVDSPLGRAPFPPDLDPAYGAFYSAWSLYLRGEYLRAAGAENVPHDFVAGYDRDCTEFAEALDRSPTPFLPSYAGAAWPVDTTVGIAALAIHDRVREPRYAGVIDRWVDRARAHLDPQRGVLSHEADFPSGTPRGGVRASSLTLMSRMLAEAAPEFAREHYAVLRSQFVDYAWGVPGIREYPHGVAGEGDVDSGPLVLGLSASSGVVGAAAARAWRDEVLARTLFGAIEVVGLPIAWQGTRRYALGAVPVGDAFIAWARSTPIVVDAPPEWERTIPVWWAAPGHALSLAVIAALIYPCRRRLRRTPMEPPAELRSQPTPPAPRGY